MMESVTDRGGPVDSRSLRSANDEYQLLRALLTNRTKRHRQRRFLVQGVRSINLALSTGWPMSALLVSESARSRWATDIAERANARELIKMPQPLIDELSQREDGAEVVGVAELKDQPLSILSGARDGVVVVAEAIQSPGNLGMIIRTADALGAAAVVVTGHAADPYDPVAVRASTGALFSVPVVEAKSVAEVLALTAGVRVVGLHPTGEPIDAVELSGGLVLIAGTESTGLSRKAMDQCDALAAIPMSGTTGSLNVGSAVAIALAEVGRRRRSE